VERKATLTPAEARRAAGHAAELLARDRRILLVYVFGSTLDTRRARVGDVDLGVLAEPPRSLDDLTRRQADLRQATESPQVELECEGRRATTPVLVCPAAAPVLLGATTLEELGLGIDPLNRRLVPVDKEVLMDIYPVVWYSTRPASVTRREASRISSDTRSPAAS